jgi:NAD(P)-dependent dehydrogenase (short-subunit alcohol dehydrogenase family)
VASSNKTALVTGSSSGLGFEVARTFLADGWNVVVNGRNEARLRDAVRRLGNAERIAVVQGSTADRSTGEAMVNAARARFGGFDTLVNNAGEFAGKPFLEVTAQDLKHYSGVNLEGTYFTTQAAVRAFIDQGRGGNIVNIGTVLIDHAISWVTATAPLVYKGAIRALTILLAAELAPHNIRVNGVSPGFIRTPLLEGADPAPFAAAALAGRMGEATDIAGAVRYLAEASHVTGHILNVDGGIVTGRK